MMTMTMTVKNTLRYVPALMLAAALGSTPVRAEPTSSDAETAITADGATSVRVVNNHIGAVKVYAVGTDGQRIYLGSVNRTQFRAFSLPAETLDENGAFQIQVFPRSAPAGLGFRSAESTGIQTHRVSVGSDQSMQLWLEPELDRSTAILLNG